MRADVSQECAAALEDKDGRTLRAHAQCHLRRHVHLGVSCRRPPQGTERQELGRDQAAKDPPTQGRSAAPIPGQQTRALMGGGWGSLTGSSPTPLLTPAASPPLRPSLTPTSNLSQERWESLDVRGVEIPGEGVERWDPGRE